MRGLFAFCFLLFAFPYFLFASAFCFSVALPSRTAFFAFPNLQSGILNFELPGAAAACGGPSAAEARETAALLRHE